ncbi:hypothetical protein VD0001_g8955 [Verticillium dahliae]|uniref:Uncharacterized protein n=1 Tax=Verticillium dahliae TaxID=27337 RepID=A0A444RKL5_VERDA|nr:hypothetical protein VD0001_g8955 [Verticillium dahliae]RXG41692.1 hypothetical protein VDGE_03772 [Verticillium dahliae]
MRDPIETKVFRPATTSPSGVLSRSHALGSQSPEKTIFDNLSKTTTWFGESNHNILPMGHDGEDAANKARGLGANVTLLRPELVRPFNTEEFQGTEFCFAPVLQYPFQKKPRTIRKAAVRAADRETLRRRQEAERLREESHDTTELQNAFEKYQKTASLPSEQSPRKKLMSEAPDAQETADGEFDEEWEVAQQHGDFEISWAKADIRNHLLNTSAPEARRKPSNTEFGPAPVVKRRADGSARANWIRQKQVDPDVKYLLTFPGGEMAAQKAYNLLGRKDMLPFETLEEASNDSVVMPEDPPSTATHTSEENRLARLEAAKAQLPEVAGLPKNDHTSNEDEVRDEEQVSDDVSLPPSEATGDGQTDDKSVQDAGDAAETGQLGIDDADRVRTFEVPSSFLDTSMLSSGGHDTPPQPSTPQALALPEQQVLDIDLNKGSDIFASALLQNRTSTVSASTVSHLSFTTPQPSSPPPSMKSQLCGIDNDSRWSPLAQSPTPSSPTPFITVGDSDQPAHDIGLEKNQATHKAHRNSSPIEALANLISPIQDMADTRVVLGQNEGRFFIRFKLPDEHAETFLEKVDHVQVDTYMKQEDEAAERETEPAVVVQELEEKATSEVVKVVSEDDPRDLLRQFVTKHQAGKARPSAANMSADTESPTAERVVAKPNAAIPTAPILPAESPRTPESGFNRASMRIETPTLNIGSDQPALETPIRNSSAKKSKRTPLGKLDANSPSPVKPKAGKRKMDEDGDDDEQKDLEKTPEPSPKRRRGLRSRKPATPGPDAAPVNSRLVRNAEKDLASVTRANTRANKSGALYPAEVLAQFAEDPLGQQWKERKAVVDARASRAVKVGAKSVHWPAALASYQTFTSDDGTDVAATLAAAPISASEPEPESQELTEGQSKKSRAVKSKLPAPVGRPRRVAAPVAPATPRPATPRAPSAKRPAAKAPEADEDAIVGKRPTRAAAQKTNIRMGLTATGTPLRRRPTRSTST